MKKDMKRNLEKLTVTVQLFIDTIIESIKHCPPYVVPGGGRSFVRQTYLLLSTPQEHSRAVQGDAQGRREEVARRCQGLVLHRYVQGTSSSVILPRPR
jgi:hypothetical protein